jgi:hypothetical protein
VQRRAKEAHIVSRNTCHISVGEIGSSKIYEAVSLGAKVQSAEITVCKNRTPTAAAIFQLDCVLFDG